MGSKCKYSFTIERTDGLNVTATQYMNVKRDIDSFLRGKGYKISEMKITPSNE